MGSKTCPASGFDILDGGGSTPIVTLDADSRVTSETFREAVPFSHSILSHSFPLDGGIA